MCNKLYTRHDFMWQQLVRYRYIYSINDMYTLCFMLSTLLLYVYCMYIHILHFFDKVSVKSIHIYQLKLILRGTEEKNVFINLYNIYE